MAVFTPVTDAQLTSWLQHYSLGQVLSLRGITAGIENSNFFLTTSRGSYVLTIFEKLAASELPFYLNLMQHLAMHQVPVPDPVMRNDGTLFGELCGKPATIVTKLKGVAQLTPGAQHCAQVGQMLAQMHLAGRTFSLAQPNLRGLNWQQQAASAVDPFLTTPQRELLHSELAFQHTLQKSPDYLALPEGPCHCDLFRDNVLFAPANTTHQAECLSGFFDFYFAGVDKWLFDVAVCVNDWCINSPSGELDPVRVQAFLRSYQTVRPFTTGETFCWRAMLRASALRFWLSRLYDVYLPRQAQMLEPHDPAHFEKILRTHIMGTAL
ncbi:homoserine kinase [Mycoavidus cysteinexigens]|uniref:Homoserine kinase n=1 Tax=Mycoavidus cysteinexigens TaxID=1553431 RepID=A0A2Z6EUN0_9BURK|nr:homoserine kinase [Mycoavidus cysteinexigens]BBE09128.1 homoserine kinase [Mycoavidus cysteinexigens]GAM52131.1 homoserine kinase [bacterium endosymbiont of Mortierella elongata FMR23-6]GLR00208.1 homoserine kinase [Mycoavidus cysteinexigens]